MKEAMKLVLSWWILQVVFCSCPPDFDLLRDGQCRGLADKVTLEFDKAYNDVVAKCDEIQGLPIIIHNEEDQKYWSSMKEKDGSTPTTVWPIGLTCNITSLSWQWTDGTKLDYKPTSHESDLDNNCKTNCVWTISDDGRWRLYGGTGWWTDPANIYCTTQLQQPLPLKMCGPFARDDEDDVCYAIGEEAESWQEAQMSCRSVGAYLASIHNAQENSFVRRLAVSDGAVKGLYLGATISGKGQQYGWIDGSPWDYQNFYPGFPMEGFGDCLAMDTSTTTGQWMNRDCSTKLPVACIRNETNYTDVDLTCHTGPWAQGGVITSPGYPFNASIPCEYFLTVDKGQVVEAQIISLEANSCCDRVIIYDDYLDGNVIANLTGSIQNITVTSKTNFMRVAWQPNGGVNVKGLAMAFHGV